MSNVLNKFEYYNMAIHCLVSIIEMLRKTLNFMEMHFVRLNKDIYVGQQVWVTSGEHTYLFCNTADFALFLLLFLAYCIWSISAIVHSNEGSLLNE